MVLVACVQKEGGEILKTEYNGDNKVVTDDKISDDEEDGKEIINEGLFTIDEEESMNKQIETNTVDPYMFSQNKGDDWVRAVTEDGFFKWIPYELVQNKESYKKGTTALFGEDGRIVWESTFYNNLPDLEKYPNPMYEIGGEEWGFVTSRTLDTGIYYCVPSYSRQLSFGYMEIKDFGSRTNMDLIDFGFGYKDEAFVGLKIEDILNVEWISLLFPRDSTSTLGFNDVFKGFEFESVEQLTINGIDMIRYEGEVIREDRHGDRRSYVIMYHFIYEGRPFSLTGHLDSYVQDEAVINEIRGNVDKCAKTIRPSEPEGGDPPIPFGEKKSGKSTFLKSS